MPRIPTIARGRVGVGAVRAPVLPRPGLAALPAAAAASVALGAADAAFGESSKQIELEQQAAYNDAEAETNRQFNAAVLEHEEAGPEADPEAFAAKWQDTFAAIQSRIPTESVRLAVERYGNRRFAAKAAQFQAEGLDNARSLAQQKLDTATQEAQAAYASAGSNAERMFIANGIRISHKSQAQAIDANEAETAAGIEQALNTASALAVARLTLNDPVAALSALENRDQITDDLTPVAFELALAKATQAVAGKRATAQAIAISLLESEAEQIQIESFDLYRQSLLAARLNGTIDNGQLVKLDAFARKNIAAREATTAGMATAIAAYSGEITGIVPIDPEFKKGAIAFAEQAILPALGRALEERKADRAGDYVPDTEAHLGIMLSRGNHIPRNVGQYMRAGIRSGNTENVAQIISLYDHINMMNNGGQILADPDVLPREDMLRLQLIRANLFGDTSIEKAIGFADAALNNPNREFLEAAWKLNNEFADEVNKKLETAADPWFSESADVPPALRSVIVAQTRANYLKGDGDFDAAWETAKTEFVDTYSASTVGTGGVKVWRRNDPASAYKVPALSHSELSETYEEQFVSQMRIKLGRPELTSADLRLLPGDFQDLQANPRWPVAVVTETGDLEPVQVPLIDPITKQVEGATFLTWWPDFSATPLAREMRTEALLGEIKAETDVTEAQQAFREQAEGEARFRAEHADLWMRSRLAGYGMDSGDVRSGKMARPILNPDLNSPFYKAGAQMVGSSAEALGLADTLLELPDPTGR